MPSNIAAPESPAPNGAVGATKRDHVLEKPEDVDIGLKPIPVEPCRLVVLVVRIVVSPLCVHELVASYKHRRSIGDHQQTAEVLHEATTQRQGLRRGIGVSLGSPIPAVVGVRTIRIIPTIRLVVLVSERHDVVQTEPIVAGNEVNALLRPITISKRVGEKIRATVY